MRTLAHRVILMQTEPIDLTVRPSGIYINGRRTIDDWLDLLGVFCAAQGCNSSEARHDVTLMVTEDLECYAVPLEYAQRAIEAYTNAPQPKESAQ